jgi:hypothetical protein
MADTNADMFRALALIFLDPEIGARAREIAKRASNAVDPVGFQDLGGGFYRVSGIRGRRS